MAADPGGSVHGAVAVAMAWMWFSQAGVDSPAGSVRSASKTTSGLTGLIRVPSAQRAADGRLGFGWQPGSPPPSSSLGGTTTYSISLGFLPAFEMAVGMGSQRFAHDLTAHARWVVRSGTSDGVGLAVGATDLKRTLMGSPTGFVVASYPDADEALAATLGVAFGHRGGLLAGARYRATPAVELLADYDARRVNVGLTGHIGSNWQVRLADLDTGAALSIGFTADLPRDRTPPRPGLGSAQPPAVASPASLADALADHGFEDVVVATDVAADGPRLAASFSDRMYTLDAANGIEAALDLMAEAAGAGASLLRARLTRRGVPVADVSVSASEWRARTERGVSVTAQIPDGPLSGLALSSRPVSPSAGRADLLLGPGVRTQIGTDYGPAQLGLLVRPELTVPLGRGLLALGRWSYPLAGELVRDRAKRFEMDRAAAAWLHAPRAGWLIQAWAGRFPSSRDALLLEAARAAGPSGWIYGVGGLVSDATRGRRAYLLAEYSHTLPSDRVQLRLLGGRFAGGDIGAGVDVYRFFRDVMVGVCLRSTDAAHLAQLRVVLPLSPRKQAAHPGALRVRLPDYLDHRQRSLLHGKNYLSLAEAAAEEIALGADLIDSCLDRARLAPAWLARALSRKRPGAGAQ